jgi:predicted small lipoprotein YifL
MRKILQLVLALTALVGLVACGQRGGQQQPAQEQQPPAAGGQALPGGTTSQQAPGAAQGTTGQAGY